MKYRFVSLFSIGILCLISIFFLSFPNTVFAAAPDAPTGLTGITNSGQIILSWTAPGNDGGSAITDYVLDYKLTASSSWSTFADGVSTSTSGTITGLVNGSQYDFRVSAVNVDGQGTASATATITLPIIYYWVGANGGNTGTASNWSTAVNPSCGTTANAIVPGVADEVHFGSGCNNTATINTAMSVANFYIDSGHTTTITQAANLTVATTTTISAGTLAEVSYTDSVGAFTLIAGTVTGTTGVMTATSYNVQSGSMSNILAGSAVVMTKTTSGTLTLSGANTFTGGLVIKAGTVAGSVTNAFGGSGTGTTTLGDSAGGSNAVTLVATAASFANPIVLASSTTGALTINSGGTCIASVTFTGGVIGNNNLNLNTSSCFGRTLAFTTGSINNSGTITNNDSYNGFVNISSVIGPNVTGVIQNGNSTLNLSGNNTFTSGLTILKGAVYGGAVNALGADAVNGLGKGVVIIGDSTGGNNAATLGVNAAITLANPIVLASTTIGVLTVGASGCAAPGTFSGGITGNNNLTIDNEFCGSRTLNFTTGSINNAGTVTNVLGIGNNSVVISSVIGPNVTGVVQNSAITALTLSGNNTFSSGLTILKGTISGTTNATAFGAGNITLGNSAGGSDAVTLKGAGATTYTNPIVLASTTTGTLMISINASGGNTPTFSGGVTGNNNLVLNSTSGGGVTDTITLSGGTANNVGTITNASTGSGSITISSIIGTNVTGVVENSTNSILLLSGNNTFTSGLIIKSGTVRALTSNNSLGAGNVTLGDSAGGSNAATLFSYTNGLTLANPIILAPSTTGVLTITASAATFTGGVTGTNNLVLSDTSGGGAGDKITFSGVAVNNTGTITNYNIVNNNGGILISAPIGPNVTGLTQNSVISPLTLSGNNSTVGDVTIATGTLALLSTTTLNVTGNWSNSGTFTANQSTVTLTSGTHTITGANTFYNLTASSSNTITFPAATTQTISNAFSCAGTAGNTININSSAPGTKATLSMGAGKTANCDYLVLTDSVATGGATWIAGTNSVNGPSNSGWTGGLVAPDAPTGLTLTTSSGQGNLSWIAPVNNGGSAITDYVLDFKLTSTSTWSTFADGVSTTTSGTITGLVNGSAYDFRVSAVSSVGQGSASSISTITLPTIYYWVGANGGNTGTASNWSTVTNATCGATANAIVPGVADEVHFGSGCNNTATINTVMSVANFYIDAGHTTTITQAANLTVATSTTITAGTLAEVSFTDSVGAFSLNGGTVTGTTGVMTATSYSVQSGTMSNILAGTSVAMTKTTSGTLTLSGANTFTGGLTIKAGTVTGQTSASAFGTATTTLGDSSGGNNAATLQAGTTLTFANPIVLASNTTGTLTINASYIDPIFSGGVTGTNNLTINNTSGVSTHTITLSGGAINNSGTITHFNTSGTSPVTISSVIGTNVTSVIENSGGTITLSGNNTFTNNGSTTFGLVIKNGTVIGTTNATAFGAGSLTLGDSAGNNSATLQGDSHTFTNPIVLGGTSGTLTIGNGFSVSPIFSGGVTGTNNFTINTGASGGYTFTFSGGSINNAGTITNSSTGASPVVISSVIGTNVLGVVQNSSTSPLTLSGNNTFSSGLTILKGTVTGVTSANALGTTTPGTGAITLGNSAGGSDAATLYANSSLTFTNPIVLASNTTGALTIGYNNNVDPIFSGGVTGNNNLIFSTNYSSHTLTFSTGAINNVGTITNSGTGHGNVSIGSVIGTNVTGVIQNKSNGSLDVMYLSGNNTFTYNGTTNLGLVVKAGTVSGTTNAAAFGAGQVTLGDGLADGVSATLYGDDNLTFANPIVLASGTTGALNIGNSANVSPTFSGGVTGNNSFNIIALGSSKTLTFSGGSINNSGIVTNSYVSGNYGHPTISAIIGSNVTGVIQNSSISALTLAGNNSTVGAVTIIAGTLVLSGTTNLNVTGNWSNAVGTGGFTANQGTVTLTSGTHTITGANTFYNLTASSSNTITLPAGTTQTISNAFSCTGTAGNPININSSVPTSQATFSKSSGTVNCDYLVLTDNNATGGATWNAGANSIKNSNVTGWTGGITVPDAPTALTPSPSNTQVALSWTAPANNGSAITDYVIDYKLTSTSTWSTFSDGTATTTTGTITGLVNGTVYNFRVSAVNLAGQGNPSSQATSTPATVPDAPTGATATAGNASATVTFSTPTSDGGSPITGYTVSGGGSDTNAGSTTLSHLITGLTNGTPYTFTVTATNAIGTSSPSAASSPVTPTTLTTVVTNPATLVSTSTLTLNGSITVTGGSNATQSGFAYGTSTDLSIVIATTTLGSQAGTTTFSQDISELSPNTTYYFRAYAVNINGTSTGAIVSTTTQDIVPNSPTGLTATAGNGQVSLTWTAPESNGGSSITDYVIDYKLTASSTWSTFADGTATTTSSTVTGLVNGTVYNFRVSAVNLAGQGNPSSQATSTPATVPDAPTSLVPTFGNTQVGLSWTAPGNNGGSAISDYFIEYKFTASTSPADWHTFADGVSTTTSTLVTSLINGTSYDFRVSTVNVFGTSTPSSFVSAIPGTVPDAPTGLLSTFGNTQVGLSWTVPVNTGGLVITDYTIDFKLTASSSWATFADVVSSSTVSTVTGLTNGLSYDFRVSAVNIAGQGSASTPASATPATVPDAPTIGIATGGNASAVVSFTLLTTAPTNGGSAVTAYTVMSNPGNFTSASSTSPITVTGLTNGTAYTFVVTATNAVGTGAPSASTSPVTPATVPDAPTAVSATGGNTQVALLWTAPVWNGGAAISDYTIEFKLDASSTWSIFAHGASTATSSTVTGLTNGSLYDFRVSAVNSAGQGDASGVVSAMPITVPDAPTSVTAIRGNAQATVTFTAPANGGSTILSYVITSNPGSISTTTTTTSGVVTGLANGTPYTFTVTATNAAGTGPASSPSSPVTPATTPDAPTSPVATAGNAQASVAFVPPVGTGGSAITSYVVTSSPDSHIGTGSGSPVVVTGLANGTPYTFTVAAINDVGTGTPSVSSVAVIPMTVPDAPTIGTTTAGNMQVSVEFSGPANNGGSVVTSYKVTSSPGSFTGTGSGSPIVVAGLTNGTPYTFTVTATNIVGTSSPSAPSSPATPVTVPDAPTGLTPTAGAGQVSLVWIAPAVTGGAVVTDYIIDYKFTASTSPTDWHTFADGVSSGVTGTVTGLQNGASYDFRVSAYNIAGVGASSGIVSSMPITVPDAPTVATAVPGNAQATVSFASPLFNGGSTITSYTITSSPGSISTTTFTTSGVVTGLTNGTPYTFVVTANNAVGVGAPSASSSPVTPVTIPGAPTAVSASEGNRQATVSFTAPDNGGTPILDYTITSSPENISTTTLTTTGVVTGLTNGIIYTFNVTARNAVGTGPASADSNPVRLSTEPEAPANLAAVVLGSSISLSWSAPANGGSAITDYIIEYQLSTGGSWAVFADATSINTTALVTGLSNRTSYDFRVSAVNIIGQSLPSNIVSATPGEPAQVFIQSFTKLTNPTIGTAIRITNEGSTEYEYQYTWCVNSSANQDCDVGSDIFSATAAKLIQAHENYDFVATSTVPDPGNYYFHIKVLYGSQSSSASQSFTAVATFPDAPTNVTATSSNAQAVITFTAPSNGGSAITNYTVTSNPGGLTGTGSASPITVTGLTNGTQYSFTVSATNGVGTGPASVASNSVIPMTIPNAPTSLTATAGNTEVVLVWVAPLIDGGSAITDYVVEYKLSSEPTTWTVFADGVGAVTTVTVTGLTNNLTYDFRVSAVNAVGQSAVNVSSASPASPVIPPSGGNNGGGSHGGSRGGNYVPPSVPTTPSPTTPTTPTNPTTPVSPTSPTTPTQSNQPIQPTVTSPKLPNEISATPVEHPVKVPTTPTTPTYPTTTGENGGLGYWWILIIAGGVGALAFVGWLIFFIRRRLAEDANI